MSEQTCGAMILIRIGNAYEHFDQNDYDTAICGLPIQGSGPCAHEDDGPSPFNGKVMTCGAPAKDHRTDRPRGYIESHRYQPSTWEHVGGSGSFVDDAHHSATPTREA